MSLRNKNKPNNRILTYDMAINEAITQLMAQDSRVFVIGQGVKSPWYVGKTTKGLYERFGPERVIDTPVSENMITGAGTGAAIAGLRPIVIHPRMDFMIYAVDQITNEAANWSYMFGGRSAVSLVIRAIINRGGEQAAQHSQALHAWFAHIPGLKVVMPASPYDAKGLLVASVRDNNPVMYIDDRLLYGEKETVPEELYDVPIGKAAIKRAGRDVTIVAASFMVREAMRAAETLASKKISAEVVDIRTIKPMDTQTLLRSIKKTGKLIIADSGWKSFGISAEIAAYVAENGFFFLKAPIIRVALPDCPAPASRVLEKVYYPSVKDIIKAVKKIF